VRKMVKRLEIKIFWDNPNAFYLIFVNGEPYDLVKKEVVLAVIEQIIKEVVLKGGDEGED